MANTGQNKKPFNQQVRQRVTNHRQLPVLWRTGQAPTSAENSIHPDLPLASATMQARLPELPLARTFSLRGEIPPLRFKSQAPADALLEPRAMDQEQEQGWLAAEAARIPLDEPAPDRRRVSDLPLPILPNPVPRQTGRRPQPEKTIPSPGPIPASRDSNWQRLETILQRHREQEQSLDIPAEPAPETPSVPDAGEDQTLSLPSDRPGRSSAPPEQVVHETETVSITTKPEAHIAETRQAVPEQGSVLQRSPAHPAADTAPHPQTTKKTLPDLQELTTRPQKPRQATEKTASPAEPLTESTPSEPSPAQVPAMPTLIAEADNDETPPPAADTGLDQATRLPLEKAWAVEIQDQEQVRKADLSKSVSGPTDLPPLADPLAVSQHQQTLQQMLQHVPAAQPSTTDIEVIPPRRVRPDRSKLQETKPPSSRPEEPPPAIPDHQSSEQGQVDTPIGPLPNDLWALLDMDMPAVQVRQHKASTGQSTETESSQTPILPGTPSSHLQEDSSPPRTEGQSESSREDFPPRSESSLDVSSGATVIQREPDESGAGSPKTGQPQADQEKGLDIEQTAHKVYQEIKRRLSREQDRHRFSS